MSKRKIILWSAAAVTAGLALALPYNPAEAQRKRPTAERKLLGVSLGSPMLRVMQMYQQPSEVQTVALATTPDSLPNLGGGMGGGMGAAGMEGMGGMGPMGGMGGGYPGMGGGMGGPGGPPPGMAGMMQGMAGMAGGPRMGGMAGAGGGVPSLPGPGGAYGGYPGGGGPSGMGAMMGGMGGMSGGPGMGGMMGGPGGPGMGMGAEGGMGMPGGNTNMPEYSNALLLIYKDRPLKTGRSEFLINEDGQVAQISLAAPAGKTYGGPGGRTARGIGLGSSFQQVVDAYGYPERHRLLPGFRFYESYYSKNYHAAFTFDTQKGMKVVRITIALAD